MYRSLSIAVVIPALNEAATIGDVVGGLPEFVDRVVIGDNGSTDGTGAIAEGAGATVVREPRRGYGAACLKALAFLRSSPPDVVVFCDADGSDETGEMASLIDPIAEGRAELVIGSRLAGGEHAAALPPVARLGNRVAGLLLKTIYGARFTDLGPFRAIGWAALERLKMSDTNYGWTAEMQIKAARLKVASCEVPVSYRKRLGGSSKVSGTVRGTIGASVKILWTFLRYTWKSVG